MTTFHVAQSIAGCLRNNPVGTIDFLEDGKGNILSDAEARIELKKLLDKGQTLLPMNDDCIGFDAFGKGCPGHEPLTGSDLTRAMLKRGDESIPCAISGTADDDDDESALRNFLECAEYLHIVVDYDGENFITDTDEIYKFAVPVLVKPLTDKEVGF